MKLRALKNFRMMDSVRGVMVNRKVGEEFTADEGKEGEFIYGGLGSGQLTCVDPLFVPANGRYKILHGVTVGLNGESKTLFPGHTVTLTQEDASMLMAMGHVKPETDGAWTPSKLLMGSVSKNKPKKMFDDLEPKAENWVQKMRR
jgi:hypothetical protein